LNGTADLIDQVLTQHHGISAAKTAVSTYATLRARLLKNANTVIKSLYNLRDFTFRYVDGATVDIAALGNDVSAPADWANEGRDGAVRLASDGTPLTWRPVRDVRQRQQDNLNNTGVPSYYSVDLLRKIIVDIKVAALTTLRLHYQKATPTLTDANPGGLVAALPAEWHDLLYEMVVLRELNDKGDQGRLTVQAELVKNMVFDMVCTERQGQNVPEDLPRYPGSSDVGLDDWP
jgi:hypothetical protein